MYKLGATEKIIIYVLSNGKGISTGELIKNLGEINYSMPAVRASLQRLRNKEIIVTRRIKRKTEITLTKTGQEILSFYAFRIKRPVMKWDGKWLLLSFNIPEKKRVSRNHFREWLKHAGFGRLNPSLWISPYNLQKEALLEMEKLKVSKYISMFITENIGEHPQELASRIWNLKLLSKQYQKLSQKYKQKHEELQKKDFFNKSEAAMKALIQILEFKEEAADLIERDPMLPAELLPAEWIGMKFRKIGEGYLQLLYNIASTIVKQDHIVLGTFFTSCLEK